MLLEDCKKLAEQTQVIKNLKSHAKDLDAFQGQQRKIQEIVDELSELVTAIQVFRHKEIEIRNLSSDQRVDQFLNYLIAIEKEFSLDKGFIIGDRFKTLKSRSKSLTEFLENELSKAWKVYKENKLPRTNPEILDLLERISTFRPTVQKIKNISSQLEGINFPKSENQLEEMDGYTSQFSEAWNSLQSNEVPEPALNFLKATSTVGASLDSLTPEVDAWLKDRGITRLFQIKLAD